MRYLSVCSGIEAATVAWHPLGWTPVAFSEIDAFPRAALAHHYPDVPNWGDLTKFKDWPDATLDLLVGGTPCQAFSVAGLRKGLDDPRGNLTLTYLAVVDRYRPEWVVWENVPGVLSQDDGRAFGAFLGGLGQLGYGFAYRVLDAQYFGLAQRRKRVFVVGHLGDWRRAAAVLFDEASLRGDPAPCRETGQVAPTVPSRRSAGGGLGTDFDCDGGVIAIQGAGQRSVGPHMNGCGVSIPGAPMYTLNAAEQHAIAHALRADGFDASEDGTGRGTPLMPTIGRTYGKGYGTAEIGGALVAHAFDARQSDVLQHAVAFAQNTRDEAREMPYVGALAAEPGMKQTSYVRQHMAVRRLTPRECERLQGFTDDYTLIPYRGKLAADGPRYKALGNSMAVPVMAWIGERIQAVEDLADSLVLSGNSDPTLAHLPDRRTHTF